MAYFTVLPQHLHGETEENQLKAPAKVAGIRFEDATVDLPDMSTTEL
jgi:hypothetical protein